MKVGVLDSLGIIWSKLIHDLTLYEHEFTIDEVRHSQFKEHETPEDREERLHTETAGYFSAQD